MKILNFGSLNIDYVYSVDHFVRPGETIFSKSLHPFCGGKGLNQSVAIARAGACVYHAGKVGKGSEMLIEALKSSGVLIENILKTDGVSGHTIIQVDKSGQNSIALFGGANHEIDNRFVISVMKPFKRNDILLLQNEINNVPYIMQRAHKKGMKIAFNPSPFSRELLSYPLEYVNWFILNEIEGKEITGESDPKKIADALLERYPSCAVVLTLGKNGVYYKDTKTELSHGIYAVKAVDTTGVGDTFTGYFLAGEVRKVDIKENLRIASIASSIAVSRNGAANSIPCIQEVLNSKLKL